ncbi:hypothetical protein 14Stepyanka_00038 [Erwinia phage Stepyanka]|uniref:Gp1.6 n=1 Tax=Erwinia phage Stepyanka TaxID=2961688 RepID=A0A9E7NPX2_9CAUD|nr:hypothetical protein 14Stepyanka_00038 [Erwinia phage Stepyanka]
MTIRLHHNKSNGIFSLRSADRSTLTATAKRSVYRTLPFIGLTFDLGASVHAIIPRGVFVEAQKGTRPAPLVVHTKFPRVRLFIERIKEVF